MKSLFLLTQHLCLIYMIRQANLYNNKLIKHKKKEIHFGTSIKVTFIGNTIGDTYSYI